MQDTLLFLLTLNVACPYLFSCYMLHNNGLQRRWEWHLLSLRAQKPKIKLLGWAPLLHLQKSAGGQMVRFLLSGALWKTIHTKYNHIHEDILRYTSDKHATHRCMHTMVAESLIKWMDKTETFCWSEHQGIDFYLWMGRTDITSKAKLILNQLLSLTLFTLGMFNGSLILKCRWHCFSHFAFSQLYIVLNCQRGNCCSISLLWQRWICSILSPCRTPLTTTAWWLIGC